MGAIDKFLYFEERLCIANERLSRLLKARAESNSDIIQLFEFFYKIFKPYQDFKIESLNSCGEFIECDAKCYDYEQEEDLSVFIPKEIFELPDEEQRCWVLNSMQLISFVEWLAVDFKYYLPDIERINSEIIRSFLEERREEISRLKIKKLASVAI